MINITNLNWNEKELDTSSFFLSDEFIYTDKKAYFDKYLLGKEFCDCSGNIYKVISKTKPTETWRKILKFLPNVYKVKLEIRSVNKTMTLEEFRNFMLTRVKELEDDGIRQEWIEAIIKAKSHLEMMG